MFSITARMDTKNRSLNEDTKSRLSKNSPSEEPQKGVKKKFIWLPPKIFDDNQNNSIKSEEKVNKKKKTYCSPIDINAEESRESSKENGFLDDYL